MSFVVRFRGVRPSGRDDAVKWVNATIEQAADVDGMAGAFTAVETFAITTYPDAANPPTLDFTTDLATLRPGWYRVRFNDPGAGVEYTSPRIFSQETIRPSTRDVAVHILNRTVDNQNNYLGDFTADTAVTDEDVEGLITKAQSRIMSKIDVDPNVAIPTESQQAVSDLIALYAAMLVELTKYGEQIQANRSPYEHLRDLFNTQLQELTVDIQGASALTDTGHAKSLWDLVAVQSNTPHWAFDDPETFNWNSST
jgi:hypothetical protein